MRFYTILVVLMLTVNGCSVLYDVSTNIELQTISKPKDSAKAGRTKIWLENKQVYDLSSVYYNGNKDIFTIQKVDRGKLYALHGITTKIELFDKNIIVLINKFNLTKVLLYKKNKYFSSGLLDNINSYITVSKKKDELIYEYTDDMEVREVKKIYLSRKKAKEKKASAEKRRIESRRLAKIRIKKSKEEKRLKNEQKRLAKLNKIKTLKNGINKPIVWYETYKIKDPRNSWMANMLDSMFGLETTYKYKCIGILKSVNSNSCVAKIINIKLSVPNFVSVNYIKFKGQAIQWGNSQVGTSKNIKFNQVEFLGSGDKPQIK
jgi:hypothetical protein